MKRFFVSILIICCLISSISASSLLFTPHHVSVDTRIHSDNLSEKDFTSIPIHVDAEGKRESSPFIHIGSFKWNDLYEPVFFPFPSDFDLELTAQQSHSDPSSFRCFLTEELRIILFPFHSFW